MSKRKIGTLTIDLEARTAGLSRDLKAAEKRVQDTERRFTAMGRTAGLAIAGIATAFAAVAVKATKMAMDVQESENLFSVSLGNMSADAQKWSKDLSKSLGLNQFELRKQVGLVFNMTTAMGLGRDEALKMSKGFVQLAADMGSFFNMPVEEAFQKLQSGISGEIEPLKRLGIVVDENTVKQVALRHGIIKTGQEMTQVQKVQARWLAITEQTRNAQGDLARTLDSPANKLRILKERFNELLIQLGQKVIPAVSILADHALKLVEAMAGVGEEASAMGKVLHAVFNAPSRFIGLNLAMDLNTARHELNRTQLIIKNFGDKSGELTASLPKLRGEVILLEKQIQALADAEMGIVRASASASVQLRQMVEAGVMSKEMATDLGASLGIANAGFEAAAGGVETFSTSLKTAQEKWDALFDRIEQKQKAISEIWEKFKKFDETELPLPDRIKKHGKEDLDPLNPIGVIQIPGSTLEERTATLRKHYEKLGEVAEKAKKPFLDLKNQISTIFTDLGRDLAENLVQWKGWGETIKGVFKSLAAAALRFLFEGIFRKLAGALSGGGQQGGGGFGGIFGSLGGVFKKIFGGAADKSKTTIANTGDIVGPVIRELSGGTLSQIGEEQKKIQQGIPINTAQFLSKLMPQGGGKGGFFMSLLGIGAGIASVFTAGATSAVFAAVAGGSKMGQGLASGGIITEPAFGITSSGKSFQMGEAGPEAIVPLNRGGAGDSAMLGEIRDLLAGWQRGNADTIILSRKRSLRRAAFDQSFAH